MKYALLTLLILAVPAFARLGETPEECVARYGSPISTDKAKQILAFQKSGLLIMAEFDGGRCACISFQHADKDAAGEPAPFTAEEAELLREANSDGMKWIIPLIRPPDLYLWTVKGEHRFTIWNAIDKRIVKIATAEHLKRETAAKAAQEKEKFKGF